MAILFSNKFLAAGARRNSISSQFVGARTGRRTKSSSTRRPSPYRAFRRAPTAPLLPAKTRRKHRDREKIAEVCSERTAIKDNQRVESFIREVGRAGLGNLFRSCLPRTVHPCYTVSLRASPSESPYGTRKHGRWRKPFRAQENDFLVRKRLFRENTKRENSHGQWVHLPRETHRNLCFRELFHTSRAQLRFSKENMYCYFLHVEWLFAEF